MTTTTPPKRKPAPKYVKEDDYTRSITQIGVDAVRTKADIIQLRDEIKAQKENWATLCAMNIRMEQQKNTLDALNKKLLTTQRCLGIVALLAAIAAFI
jgi:hypothetical protein